MDSVLAHDKRDIIIASKPADKPLQLSAGWIDRVLGGFPLDHCPASLERRLFEAGRADGDD
jgi:hypothetical protein